MNDPQRGQSQRFQRNCKTQRRNGNLTFALSFVCPSIREPVGQLTSVSRCVQKDPISKNLGNSCSKTQTKGWGFDLKQIDNSNCFTESLLVHEIRSNETREVGSSYKEGDSPCSIGKGRGDPTDRKTHNETTGKMRPGLARGRQQSHFPVSTH